MRTVIYKIGNMLVEMPLLDEEGERMRGELNELAYEEYTRTGTLNTQRLSEAIGTFNREIEAHVLDDDADGRDERRAKGER